MVYNFPTTGTQTSEVACKRHSPLTPPTRAGKSRGSDLYVTFRLEGILSFGETNISVLDEFAKSYTHFFATLSNIQTTHFPKTYREMPLLC